MRFKPCKVSGCDKNSHHDAAGRRGLCVMHYRRLQAHGDVTITKRHDKPTLDWINEHASHESDECLKWPFAIGADGYGRVHMPNVGHMTTASRLMCIVAHGNPPTSKHEAAHSCGKGNEACTNPKHIYWATPTQNQRDRVAHRTSNRGERQWKAKLTECAVIKIRALLESTSQAEIARMFDVDASVISDIKRKKKWAWVA